MGIRIRKHGNAVSLLTEEGREIGSGTVHKWMHGAPSFRSFYLSPWGYLQIMNHGGEAYPKLFPWVVCYARLDRWSPFLKPLVCSNRPVDGLPPQWLKDMVKELV